MPGMLLDDLADFIRGRVAAAAADKALYDRNGARLNGQLLQGEINMGKAMLAWLDARGRGEAPELADEDEDADVVGE